MTAPVTFAAKSRRRTSAAPAVELAFPVPASGQILSVGLGDWETYLTLDQALCDRGFRVRFHRGQIQIMSISFTHEAIKAVLRRLIETYCEWKEMDMVAWGSTTQRVEGVMGGEPDESYAFRATRGRKPDMVLEIALSSGGISKLPFWAEKGIPEVWIWEKNRLLVFGLKKGSYQPLTRSKLLPDFPLPLAEKLAKVEPTTKAVREFRRRLTAKK
jgi:Uma2 family endonuclease